MPKNKKQKFSTSDSFCVITSHINYQNDIVMFKRKYESNAVPNGVKYIETSEIQDKNNFFYETHWLELVFASEN